MVNSAFPIPVRGFIEGPFLFHTNGFSDNDLIILTEIANLKYEITKQGVTNEEKIDSATETVGSADVKAEYPGTIIQRIILVYQRISGPSPLVYGCACGDNKRGKACDVKTAKISDPAEQITV